MELTSIYGEMFNGEIVAEHDNVVIAEDSDGVRYTVHKSKLGNHTPVKTSGYLKNMEFDVIGTMMTAVKTKQMDRILRLW